MRSNSAIPENPGDSTDTTYKSLLQRVGHGVGLGVLGSVIGFGLANADGVDVELDGLRLNTQFSVGSGAVGNFEPLGKVRMDLGLPLNAGFTVEATDIPVDPDSQAQLLAASGDIEGSIAYVRDQTLGGLRHDTAVGALAGLLVGCAYDRRYFRRLSPFLPAFGGAAVAAYIGVIQPSGSLAGEDWRRPPSTIEGFDTAGIEVSGQGLNYAVDKIETSEQFFDVGANNMETTLADVAAEAAARNQDILMYATDLHFRSGMARIIARALSVTEAKALLDGGDFVLSGDDWEDAGIYIYDRLIPDTVEEKAGVLGGHDSEETGRALENAGWTVADGEVFEIAGLTVIGYPDPIRTMTGRPQSLRDPEETVEEFEARINREICAHDERPDILLLHDLRHAQQAIDEGCVENALGGHMHTQIGPFMNEHGTMSYTASNSGGSIKDTPSLLGPLDKESTLTLLFISKAVNGRSQVLEGMQTVVTATDATTSLSPYVAFPGRQRMADPRLDRVER